MRARNPLVIHYVHDMARAKRFYTQAFDVQPNFESAGWTTLNFGAMELALHILHPEPHPEPKGSSTGERDGQSTPKSEPERPLPHAGLNLEVDRIEDVQRDIERLGGRLLELREPGGGVPVRVASFRDCEGNGFELRQVP